MNKKPIPSEDEIAELLGYVQPQPGEKFQQQMRQQPWNQQRHVALWGYLTPLRAGTTLGLILLLAIGFSLFFPADNTLAQRLSQYFFPATEERIRAEIDPREIAYPLERFNLSLEEAEELAGFTVKMPTEIPSAYQLTGATHDEIRQAIILNYTSTDGKLVLRISQQYLDPDYQSISPSAQIEQVMVGNFTGEYVVGGWKIPNPEVESGAESNPKLGHQAVWDAAVDLQTLRWTDGEFLYEIMLAGGAEQPAYLNQEGLIALAIQMQ